jgi:hypothetical protein
MPNRGPLICLNFGGFSVQIESPSHEFFGQLYRPAQFRPEQPLRRGGDFHLSRFATNRSRVGLSNRCALRVE